MKIAESTIIIVPGFGGAEPTHWASRWQTKISSAQTIELHNWNQAAKAVWVQHIVEAVDRATKPVILVGHSLGVAAIAHAAPLLTKPVAGAFLVALSDWNRPDLIAGVTHDFAPMPQHPLPFKAALVASRNDPYCDFEVAEAFARHWHATLIDAGESGHINVESGHGPWPEGMMSFAAFLNKL